MQFRPKSSLAIAVVLSSLWGCSSDPDDPAVTSGVGGGGGATAQGGGAGVPVAQGGVAGANCLPDFEVCDGSCVAKSSYATDAQNCGRCGNVCSTSITGPSACANNTCGCMSGYNLCNGNTCVDFTSDPNNCGSCGTKCASGQCSGRQCVGGGTGGTGQGGAGQGGGPQGGVGQGGVGKGGAGPQGGGIGLGGVGQGGAGPQGGGIGLGGAIGLGGDIGQGGAQLGGGSQGGSSDGGTGQGGGPTAGTTSGDSMISDFENGEAIALPLEGRSGCWERFFETDVAAFTMEIESSDAGGNALHAVGSSSAGWGGWVGMGVNLNETGTCGSNETTNPQRYDASKYAGIRFKAKIGSGHDSKSAVRFNVSIPETEGPSTTNGDYLCDNANYGETTTKAARDCYQHLGRFLHVVSGFDKSDYADNELSSDWKTFTYCFASDYTPLSLPGNLTNPERNTFAERILKIQFQFNQGKDWYVGWLDGEHTDIEKTKPFDFWLDDLEFVGAEACPKTTVFPSQGASKPFPQNQPAGPNCQVAQNAPAMAANLSHEYWRWTKNFVRDNKVIAPEQEGGVTTSEAMGYGMLIAASMGDKTAFDKFLGYVESQGGSGGNLMTWKPGGSGSATDGDVDIAYALLMAEAQWGGYQGKADAMIGGIKSGDLAGGSKVNPGNSWDSSFNPSYFAPSYFRKYGGLDSLIDSTYGLIETNTGSNFPTDWADWSGNGIAPTGDVKSFNVAAYGYDAARVPWRVGLDGCTSEGTRGKALAGTIVDFFAGKYDSGATIDLLKAGWIKSSGNPAASGEGEAAPARDFQGSFIGPIGVGAMASGNATVRDRSFRTIMDILDNGAFNSTYFPSTVGLITALIMSGNFPAP